MSIVKSIPMLNGLNKAIAFAQMWKNEIFVSCMLFLKEIKKKEQNRTFSVSSLTLSTRQATTSVAAVYRGSIPCRLPSWVECAGNKVILKKSK